MCAGCETWCTRSTSCQWTVGARHRCHRCNPCRSAHELVVSQAVVNWSSALRLLCIAGVRGGQPKHQCASCIARDSLVCSVHCGVAAAIVASWRSAVPMWHPVSSADNAYEHQVATGQLLELWSCLTGNKCRSAGESQVANGRPHSTMTTDCGFTSSQPTVHTLLTATGAGAAELGSGGAVPAGGARLQGAATGAGAPAAGAVVLDCGGAQGLKVNPRRARI